ICMINQIVYRNRLAPLRVIPCLDAALLGRYHRRLGARFLQRLPRLEQLDLLDAVGGQNGHAPAFKAPLVHGSPPLLPLCASPAPRRSTAPLYYIRDGAVPVGQRPHQRAPGAVVSPPSVGAYITRGSLPPGRG